MNNRNISIRVLCTIFFLLMANVAHAEPYELLKIRKAIKQKGAKWVAKETAISRLPPKTRHGLLLSKLPARPVIPGKKLPFSLPPLPESFDWRNVDGINYISSVKQQVGGTCIAFANTAALESCVLRELDSYVLRMGPLQDIEIDLSEHALVSCNSGYPSSVAEFMINTGLPSETCYPFNASSGDCSTACAGWKNITYKVENHQGYRHLGIKEVKALIVLNGPIVAGMNVPSEFFNYSGGVYSSTMNTSIGFHEVLIIGYDDHNQCFIVKNSWGTGWGENGYFRIAYSEFQSGTVGGVVDFAETIDSFSGVVLTSQVALKTTDGHYTTVVNGGGLGGPNTGPNAVAIHTDAVKAGPWERFHVEWIDSTHFALKTANGNYITAVNGGSLGGPNNATSPVHTDASLVGPWEKLTFNYSLATKTATLQTQNGRYLTAVNGGGFGGPNNVPIHTDAKNIGSWEIFTVEVIK